MSSVARWQGASSAKKLDSTTKLSCCCSTKCVFSESTLEMVRGSVARLDLRGCARAVPAVRRGASGDISSARTGRPTRGSAAPGGFPPCLVDNFFLVQVHSSPAVHVIWGALPLGVRGAHNAHALLAF